MLITSQVTVYQKQWIIKNSLLQGTKMKSSQSTDVDDLELPLTVAFGFFFLHTIRTNASIEQCIWLKHETVTPPQKHLYSTSP